MNKKIVVAILLLCVALCMGCLEEKQTYVQEVVEESINETISESTIIPIQQPIIEEPEIEEYNEPVYDYYIYRAVDDNIYVDYRIINGGNTDLDLSFACFSLKISNQRFGEAYSSRPRTLLSPGEEIRGWAVYKWGGDGDKKIVFTPENNGQTVYHDDSVLNENEYISYDFKFNEYTNNISETTLSGGPTIPGSMIYIIFDVIIHNNGTKPFPIIYENWRLCERSHIFTPDSIGYTDEIGAIKEKIIHPGEIIEEQIVFQVGIQQSKNFYQRMYIQYEEFKRDNVIIWETIYEY